MTSAPSPFSPTLPTMQVAWDSTSLGWLKQCPRAYRYQMILGWEPRTRGIHLTFGSLYASALERYAHTKASGSTHDEAVLAMVRWAMENSGTQDNCPVCDGQGILHIGSERACDCPQCNGTGGVFLPWTPTEPEANFKNRYTLIRTLVWNAEDRLTSPFSTLILDTGKPATELSFNFPAFEIDNELICLTGHLDEVVTEPDGSLWIRDDKTTKSSLDASYFSRYTPDNQMSLYSFAGKIVLERPIRGVLVKAAQIGVNFSRFRTAQIPRPNAVLEEWFEDTKFWIGQAKGFAERGHWPMNDKACFLCSFKKVCAVSPSHREAHLREDFVSRRWNPLQARGDI